MVEHIMQRRIGIWGYGSVGKSFIRFLRWRGYSGTIHLFDDHTILEDIVASLQSHNVEVYAIDQRAQFLRAIDVLLPSPGVAVPASLRCDLLVCNEYTLFRELWPGRVIAITGTIGKTTVTSLIAHLLKEAGASVRMGGNIGIPLLDLLPEATVDMVAVIELSSFQLEYGIANGPDLAIITNCYPNHLDRHGDFAAYVGAKMNLVTSQVPGQCALVPMNVASYLPPLRTGVTCAWFTDEPHAFDRTRFDTVFWRNGAMIIKSHGEIDVPIATVPTTKSFVENWLIAYAALDLMGYPIVVTHDIAIPDHRLTYIMTVRGISFFNDSKATVPQATLAAVKKIIRDYQQAPVLFLGGLSKGVDRKPLLHELASYVQKIVIFGREADQLARWAHEENIVAHVDTTLEGAFNTYTKKIAREHDIVLFSPSGSSHDLFHDFQDRGNCFIQLVYAFANG